MALINVQFTRNLHCYMTHLPTYSCVIYYKLTSFTNHVKIIIVCASLGVFCKSQMVIVLLSRLRAIWLWMPSINLELKRNERNLNKKVCASSKYMVRMLENIMLIVEYFFNRSCFMSENVNKYLLPYLRRYYGKILTCLALFLISSMKILVRF